MTSPRQDRSAVIDIGSNSVRMVAFDSGHRSLEPLYNEKAMSGLGRNLLQTGRLDPEGRQSALAVLARFRAIGEALGVSRVRAVATAAARQAEDGAAFIFEAEDALGADIEVISGEEEARLSALGVICGVNDADGVMGDLGGGSLEIADVAGGAVGATMSLPLGPLALGEIVGKQSEIAFIDKALAALPKGMANGRSLYVVGGAWRALAKHHVERARHPIRIVHEHVLSARQATELAKAVGAVKPADLGKLKGVSGRRRPNAPYSGRLLARLIRRIRPERIVFSAYGLREGVEYDRMPAEQRALDPLIDHCRRIGQATARMPFDGDRLAGWAVDAFLNPPASERLLRAASWLSDMSGYDHPDYRGHHAAARALHLASAGIDHRERVFLAATVYARYHGFGMESALGRAANLLSDEERRQATALGIAFRLAHAIEPGEATERADSLRARVWLKRKKGVLALEGPPEALDALGETAMRRFASLARALEVEAETTPVQSAAA